MQLYSESSWPMMLLMAIGLGIKHGLDLDHLATIDAIARTTRHNRNVSKWTGFLFSLGHGIVVTAVSAVLGGGIIEAQVPQWLNGVGHWISFFFLVLFGLLNLWSVFQPTSSQVPLGLQSFLAKKLIGREIRPAMILAVGALFAFSFDTFSQIALFAISATLMGGWWLSITLGVCFTLGMIFSDGLNGLVISSLIQKADKRSQIVSRLIGLCIAIFSLGIALYNI